MTHPARRMFELLEPICLVTFFADECNAELAALGHRTYWDGYFASRAATRAPTNGRMMFAGMRTLPVPGDPVARLWHSATMLREHRGDGHIAALLSAGVGGTEAHILSALAHDIHPPETFGRVHHLPAARLAAVMAGLRERGLVDADGRFTDAGRETQRRVEEVTDELAAPPYDALSPAERNELTAALEPLTARLVAAGSS